MQDTKTDVILKNFWQNNERFADLFNVVLFEGEEIIKPEALEEMDTDVSGVIRSKDYEETLSRTRDVIKKTAYGIAFVILGIENQQHIHYAMPLRHMAYDTMSYLKEYREITGNFKNSKEKNTKEEFLSRMKKEDRLHPVITLTIYYGEEPWDGPYCLKDMLTEMPEKIMRVVSDYRMNLLEVRDSARYRFNHEEVQSAFEITREIFEGHFKEIQEKYKKKTISPDLLSLIGKMTGSKELMHMNETMEVENMCTALEKLKEEGRAEGRAEGIAQGRKTIILNMLQSNYPIAEICKISGAGEEEVLAVKKENGLED